ncbi:Hypotetical protein [Gulosibacter molinativorax]|nr:Hypotetical protein [Gulosibacter molinativorax]
MDFPFGRSVTRLRAGVQVDPYSGEETFSDWSNPSSLVIEGAFVAHTSTSMLATATREQALEAKSLFCGEADIRKGDRIVDGDYTYTIDGIPPAADTNPFTNWTPPREIPLTRYEG